MKYLLITLAIVGSSSLFAQSIERQVIGSTGGTASSGSVIVTSTVGETAITLGTSSAIILTQGYQQSSTSTVSIDENVLEVTNLKLFPNPTTNASTLVIVANNGNTTLQVDVFNSTGKLIFNQSVAVAEGVESKVGINMNSVSAGVYLVRITDSNSTLSKTLRLVKQ